MMEKKKKDYRVWYNRMTERIRKRKHGVQALRLADHVLTGVMYAVYPVMLVAILVSGGLAGSHSPVRLGRSIHGSGSDAAVWNAGAAVRAVLPYILIPGISFVLVSIVRDRINWKRPYEEWAIEPLIHKNTKGHSMPSRHVFSSAVISMCALSLQPPVGVVLLLLTVVSAIVRVLGGVHYPRDVAAGFVIGITSGIVLFLV